MRKEESYEQVYSQRVDKKNIQIIKKFFVFQPIQTSRPAPMTHRHHRNLETLHENKKLQKFPAGFLQQPTHPQDTIFSEEDSPIIVKSKRVPTSELNSFLLGLTHRINQETEQRAHEGDTSNPQHSPERRIKYDEVIRNLSKIRRESRLKIVPNFQSTKSSTQPVTETELPQLSKRLSTPYKKPSQATTTNTYTPNLNRESEINDAESEVMASNLSCNSQKKVNEKIKKNSSNNSILKTAKLSSKAMKLLEDQPIFMKGYLNYDIPAKTLLEENSLKLGQSLMKKSLNTPLTAKNYIVMTKSLEIVCCKNEQQQIQIASLTKIMTCYLCLLVCAKYNVNMKETMVRVSDKAAEMPGTSAELQAGDLLTLYDLLYGLMLPSGNDASVAVAETAGKIIQRNKKKATKKTYYETFIAHMNLLAKELKIEQSYQNSSGLSLNPNFSTPAAISTLTALALLNKQFFQIVNTKEYEVEIKNERFGLVRKSNWKNTNKLLWKGWEGVKTGTTQTAGHCLMACIGKFIISVYNCETLGKRFTECSKIYDQIREQTGDRK